MIRAALLALALALGGGMPPVGVLLDALAGDWTSAAQEAGTNLDPDGAAAPADAGGIYDPDGAAASADAGTNLDPNG